MKLDLKEIDAVLANRKDETDETIEKVRRSIVVAILKSREFEKSGLTSKDLRVDIDKKTGEIQSTFPLDQVASLVRGVIKKEFELLVNDRIKKHAEENILFRLIFATIYRCAENGNVYAISRDKNDVLLPVNEQIPGEKYEVGTEMCFYAVEMRFDSGMPIVVVSRSHPNLIKELFAYFVPEIGRKEVEIMGVARDVGSRAKVAIRSNDKKINPINALLGKKRSRISKVVSLVGGEKIDLILYSDDIKQYIANALRPAKVIEVFEDPTQENKYKARVFPEITSLAIGPDARNVRLAVRVTGAKIDIVTFP
jgi:transcription termination factor NusA